MKHPLFSARPWIPVVLSFLSVLFFVQPAFAVCIAAGDEDGFLNALAAWENNSSPTTIKLEQGTYQFTTYFVYDGQAADLTILGGYTPGIGCNDLGRPIDASKTILDLSNQSIWLYGAALRLENLTVTDGANFGLTTDALVLEELRFTQITNSPWFSSESDAGGLLKLTNVQVDNTGFSEFNECAFELYLGSSTTAYLNHVTVETHQNRDFCLSPGPNDGNKRIEIWNSIIWDSSGGQIRTFSSDGWSTDPITIRLHDSIYPLAGLNVGNDPVVFDPQYPSLQQDPFWTDPATGDYGLTIGPAVNSGTVNAPGGEPWYDIGGTNRQIGSAPDMGAHESFYDDYAGGSVFTVTNTLDDGSTGSLRWAINKANQYNGNSLIKFNIAGLCPRIISLSNPLPPITAQLTIDGYSQPGALANTSSAFFNANLCLALQPTVGSSATAALTVPAGSNGSLTVRGLGIGGFADGILLQGGSNHQIVGNQFGGLMNGATQLYGFDQYGLLIDMTGPVIIGGSALADRNIFLNADSFGGPVAAAAIQIGAWLTNADPQTCQIINNLVGIRPESPSSTTPNHDYGIRSIGSGCTIQDNRLVNGKKDAIALLYGASNHVVQNNRIGGPTGIPGLNYSDLGAGIRIVGDDNVIGRDLLAGNAGLYGNIIANMDGGGIIVDSGTGNTIRGNDVSSNDWVGHLNIDLADDGQSPNDSGDTDSGANNLQNYPVLHGLTWTNGIPDDCSPPAVCPKNAATVVGVLNTGVGNYHLDAYYAADCSSGRGSGYWIGGADQTIVQGTTAASFALSLNIPGSYNPTAGKLSVTATRYSDGSTSELSRCVSIDTIFQDGIDM